MSTKTKKTRIARTVRPGIKSRIAIKTLADSASRIGIVNTSVPAPAVAVRKVEVHVHPRQVEFVVNGEFSDRMPNGSVNSDAFVQVERKIIAERATGAAVSFRFFDGSWFEISREQAAVKDVALTETLV